MISKDWVGGGIGSKLVNLSFVPTLTLVWIQLLQEQWTICRFGFSELVKLGWSLNYPQS